MNWAWSSDASKASWVEEGSLRWELCKKKEEIHWYSRRGRGVGVRTSGEERKEIRETGRREKDERDSKSRK